MEQYYPLIFETGSVSDIKYHRGKNCLLYAINSVSCKPYGVCKDLHEKYPHEDSVTSRTSLTFVSRARRCDRDIPGDIILQRSPHESSPHLIAMITQFGYGQPYVGSVEDIRRLALSMDYHYVEGIKQDTENKRVKNFQECIKKIIIFALGCDGLESIIIPAGVGTRGNCGQLWNSQYLPILQNMASRLQASNIKVIITSPTVTEPKPDKEGEEK